jgi:hypothetical protein
VNSNTASHTVHAETSVSPAEVVAIETIFGPAEKGMRPFIVTVNNGGRITTLIGYGFTPHQARQSLGISFDDEVLACRRATKKEVDAHA